MPRSTGYMHTCVIYLSMIAPLRRVGEIWLEGIVVALYLLGLSLT